VAQVEQAHLFLELLPLSRVRQNLALLCAKHFPFVPQGGCYFRADRVD
jgi:hypothetical protein